MDTIICGICQCEFPLGDICAFIKHKVNRCDKENFNSLPKDTSIKASMSADVIPSSAVQPATHMRPQSSQGSIAASDQDPERCIEDDPTDRPMNLSSRRKF